MNTEVMFSSKKDDWETPDDLFQKLDDEFHFEHDVCAELATRKCYSYWDKYNDSLTRNWSGAIYTKVFWMNPPYGREIGKWVKKAYEESQKGCTVVCLLPARTDTKWFHEYCLKGEIRWIKGRLKFKGAKNSAPFPSMIVIFRS